MPVETHRLARLVTRLRVLATLRLVSVLQSECSHPLTVFKGPVHTVLLESGSAWRECADIDVMTTAAGRIAVGRWLQRRGWVQGRSPSTLLHRAWRLRCPGYAVLVQRHDPWVRRGFAALELHSRAALDCRRMLWGGAELARSAVVYDYHGVRFSGAAPSLAAGLAVWNAAHDAWAEPRGATEALLLTQACGVPPGVPREAVDMLRWASGLCSLDQVASVPRPLARDLAALRARRRADPVACPVALVEEVVSPVWDAWAGRSVSPLRFRVLEALRRSELFSRSLVRRLIRGSRGISPVC